MVLIQYLLILSFQVIIGTIGQNDESIEHCIDAKYHKKRPAKEDSLHQQCEPWKQYSCCTEETAITAHEMTNHYKFNYNHCPQKPMSDKCRKHFIQDLCFYECEPFVKPWVKKVNRSFARERIFKVPICSSDCDLWWSDCKNDYTCAYNWPKGFKWHKGVNECPDKAECKPIHHIYSNAKDFCEKVWDHSWQYTTEDKPCMRIWFNGTKGNPNKATAQYYQSLNTNSSPHLLASILFFPLFLIFISFQF